MRWDQGHQSDDVIDRRGEGRSAGMGGGLLGFVPLLLRMRYGWIGIILILLVSVGGGLTGIFNRGQSARDGRAKGSPDEQAMVSFVSFVLDDNQATWKQISAEQGLPYRNSKLVLYTGSTSTSCGYGSAAAGPFYCPADERVYIDLSFYRELAGRFGAAGDFAQAYVIAHEIGHHIQKLRGISEKTRGLSRSEREGADSQSVRLELQADCFAGVWAKRAQGRDILEEGDLDEALRAAAAIGDDSIQRESGGAVHPESWTHGSAEQRGRWLRRGYEVGSPDACDTFGAKAL